MNDMLGRQWLGKAIQRLHFHIKKSEIKVNGKTIGIDAPIYVPEVETLPVIRVMREKTVENTEALFKKEGTKYNEMDCYNRSRHKKETRS